MSFSCRPLTLLYLSTFVAAAAAAAPLSAQTEEVPVVELEPPEAQPPVVEASPAPAAPAEIQSPELSPASDPPSVSAPSPGPARARANAGQSAPDEVAASASLPPLPSGPAIVTPPATVPMPDIDGPVAIVPNASGTPIIVQPPVIEPPKVIDEPWTLGHAIPWLIAGLLIGGSLVVLFLQRRRRRIVTWRAQSISGGSPETGPLPTTVVELGPAPPPAAGMASPAVAAGPKVLVRKVDRTSAPPERAEPRP